MSSPNLCVANVAIFFLVLLLNTPCNAHLSSTFYENTCPNALSTIRTVIRTAVSRERRMAASLIRLHFHDCFVQVSIKTVVVIHFCLPLWLYTQTFLDLTIAKYLFYRVVMPQSYLKMPLLSQAR